MMGIAPNNLGEPTKMHTKQAIEATCCTFTESKYRQTKNTPFMQSPLKEAFGYLGDTQAA
jgi:hypothetical protein